MKRYFPGLSEHAAKDNNNDGQEAFLVQVERARHRYHFQKPFYQISFVVLEPRRCVGKILSGRLYCTPRALWKLRWFLKDFAYDADLIQREELDEKALTGLRGVIKI